MFLEQQISVCSGGSCDTENWSNDAENSASHHNQNGQKFQNITVSLYF